MAISLVQHATPGGTSSNTNNPVVISTSNFGSAITSGNLIVVCIGTFAGGGNPSVNSVTDTLGNTYTFASGSLAGGAGSVTSRIYYTVSGSGGTNAVTVSLTNSGTEYGYIDAIELAGQSASPFDTAAVAGQTTSQTATTASFNTAGAGVIVATCSCDNGLATFSAGSGFTLLNSALVNGGNEYQITSAAQTGFTASMGLSSSGGWVISAASFLAAAATAPIPLRMRSRAYLTR